MHLQTFRQNLAACNPLNHRFAMLFLLLLSTFMAGTKVHAQELPRYSCVSKQFNSSQWMNQYQRKYDAKGVVTQKGQYHPLSIAFYGIMNYDDYLLSKDTTAYRHILNQFRYFLSDSNLTWIDERKGAGLPYRTNFKDLKAPWYSGMTQGVAISFMLRYHALTKDARALELAQKFAYFMLKPADKGGTIAKTPEGDTWIEEYPNSKQSQQVLNGFINGLIGLYEYTLYFPKDTLAKRIHDESFSAMLRAFPIYDTHEWTNYNRNSSAVTNQYMRYQLTQLDHLFEIYKEQKLMRQMKIWSFFAHQKFDKELKFYKNPIYQFGFKMLNNGTLEALQDSLFFARGFKALAHVDIGRKPKESPLPYLWLKKKAFRLTLRNPSSYLIIRLDSLDKNFHIDGIALDENEAPVDVELNLIDNNLHVKSCLPFTQLTLDARGNRLKSYRIKGIDWLDTDNIFVPKFLFDTLSGNFKLLKNSTYRVNYETRNICDFTLFYKFSDKEGPTLKRAHWRADQFIEDPRQPFVPPVDGYYKFFYAFRYLQPKPSFQGFKIEAVN